MVFDKTKREINVLNSNKFYFKKIDDNLIFNYNFYI